MRSLAVAKPISAPSPTEAATVPTRSQPRWRVWRRLRRHRLAMLGLIFLGLLILCALSADIISPYRPLDQATKHRFAQRSVV